ncbi:metalloendopeptidase [Coemansia sp. RSA 2706]|nr:metalloendopeptidase [Coemansia sp. RSA 2706]
MREDVYKVVRAVYTNQDEMAKLSAEDRRLVEKTECEFRRSGLLLSQDKREELSQLKKQLATIVQQFTRHVNEQVGKVWFTKDELMGMPASFFEDRETVEEAGSVKYQVTTQYPDYIPLMKYAQSEATRKSMYVVYGTRCPENVSLLQEAVDIRQKIAKMLGYATHSQFMTEVLMSKTPEAVIEMETDMRARLTPLAQQELVELEALKKEHVEAAGQTYAGFYRWDLSFYNNLLMEKKHQINSEQVKEYFPLAQVKQGILDIYQQMLSLRLIKVDNPDVWHPDVDLYEVWEATEDTFVGHIYMDLFPRDNKYQHAACFYLRRGYEQEDGSREYPAAALVTNFTKPTSTTPSLLTHREVETFMHELGHAFHHMCAQTKWACFQGTAGVERDFVECPSQMLEYWAWEPKVLQKFAHHYKTGDVIPVDLINKLVAAKNHGAGILNIRQVFLGTIDTTIYNSTEPVDINSLYNRLGDEIGLISSGDTQTFSVATFGHIASGYDSRYYGYLWSESIAADLFKTRFMKDGIDNPQTGLDYRREILAPGGSRDAMDSIVKFLGRKPNNQAFLEFIGLSNN